MFLAIAEKLGVDPAKCLAFEDAPAGVESAREAGMAVIGVRDALFPQNFLGTKKIIDEYVGVHMRDVE